MGGVHCKPRTKPGTVAVEGERVRAIRERMRLSQQSFASVLGVHLRSISNYESPGVNGMARPAFDRMMQKLGWSEAELRRQLGAPPLEDPPQNIEVGSLQRYYEIPTFDRDLAAGHWTEAIGVGGEVPLSPEQIQQGLFRVRLSGDSMTPRYKDGDLVEFRIVPIGVHDVIDGADYYVQRHDQMATFKTVWCHNGGIVLRARNRRKYKDEWHVNWEEIVRLARAVAKVERLDV